MTKPKSNLAFKIFLLSPISLSLISCLGLQTRRDMSNVTPVIQTQERSAAAPLSPKAQAKADIERQELESKIRQLLGRVEELENQKQIESGVDKRRLQESDKKIVDLENRIKLLEQTIVDQENKIKAYEMSSAQSEQASAAAAAIATAEAAEKSAPVASKSNKTQNLFDKAEASFNQKDYKKAILEFNQFRDENPKSKKLATATYRIAVSFHELGMKEEAKAFYQEIIEKYPKSAEVSKAKFRLKQLK